MDACYPAIKSIYDKETVWQGPAVVNWRAAFLIAKNYYDQPQWYDDVVAQDWVGPYQKWKYLPVVVEADGRIVTLGPSDDLARIATDIARIESSLTHKGY